MIFFKVSPDHNNLVLNLGSFATRSRIANLCEIGSNSNGNYIKYSNGILICYNSLTVYHKGTVTLPKGYVDTTFSCQVQFMRAEHIDIIGITPISNNKFQVGIHGYDGSTTIKEKNVSYISIGKWK